MVSTLPQDKRRALAEALVPVWFKAHKKWQAAGYLKADRHDGELFYAETLYLRDDEIIYAHACRLAKLPGSALEHVAMCCLLDRWFEVHKTRYGTQRELQAAALAHAVVLATGSPEPVCQWALLTFMQRVEGETK